MKAPMIDFTAVAHLSRPLIGCVQTNNLLFETLNVSLPLRNIITFFEAYVLDFPNKPL